MKMTMFLLLAGALHLSAGVKAQTAVTLRMQDVSVQEVLNRLERLTDYTFLYKMDLLEGCGKVDVDVRNEDFGAVLRSVLEPWNLTYRLEDKVVVLMPRPQLQAQELAKKLTGKVTDEEGMPLPGVTVLIKGTQLGTATDADGKYELTVPQGGITLVFSMVGMKVREELVGDRTEINVVMEEEAAEMDEVVVTGIFKKARESYTGAVSTITDEELKMHRGQNLLQTLKNIDVSLNFRVDNLSGSDPNALPSISIRGSSSLPMSVQEFNQTASNAVNQPLIIMDGFEISLEKLMDYNDEEIESINTRWRN